MNGKEDYLNNLYVGPRDVVGRCVDFIHGPVLVLEGTDGKRHYLSAAEAKEVDLPKAAINRLIPKKRVRKKKSKPEQK